MLFEAFKENHWIKLTRIIHSIDCFSVHQMYLRCVKSLKLPSSIWSNRFLSSLTDYTEEAEFTMSRAGQLKLTHDNHAFYKHSILKPSGQTFWRCDKYKSNKCKVKAYTITIGEREMVKVYGLHTHDPDYKI